MIVLDDPVLGGRHLRDLGTIYATLGECGEVILLALKDGARTPEEIRVITGLIPKLISVRLRVLVDLKLIAQNAGEYVLTEGGLELAQIIEEKGNL